MSTETVGTTRVLDVEGEVDVHTAPALRDRISGLIGEQDPNLIVDLNSISFIDSTGLGVLVAGHTRADGLGGALSLVCAQERVLKLFRITGLDEVFTIHPSVEAATT